jgi:hypothetical protein
VIGLLNQFRDRNHKKKEENLALNVLVLKVGSSITTVSPGIVHFLHFFFLNNFSSPDPHWGKRAPSRWPVSFFGIFTKPVGVKSASQNTKRICGMHPLRPANSENANDKTKNILHSTIKRRRFKH